MKHLKYSLVLSTLLSLPAFAIPTFQEDVISRHGHKYNLRNTSDHVKGVLHSINHNSGKMKASHVQLPAQVDLSMYATIFDQGSLGSCTANSSAVCTQVRERIQLHLQNPSLSIEQVNPMVDPMARLVDYQSELAYDTYGVFETDQPIQDNGSSIGTSLLIMHKFGVPRESYWPYDTTKFGINPPVEVYSHCNDNKDDATTPEMLTPGDLYSIKLALHNYIPVQMGATLFPQFESDDAAETGIITVPTDQDSDDAIGGHATAILGYNDNLSIDGVKGFFTVANSWGTSWGATLNGQRGFYYLPYAYVSNTELVSELGQYSNMSFTRN